MKLRLGELQAIQRAFHGLDGEQSIDDVRSWVKRNAEEHYQYRRIGTIIRGHSNLEKARDRHRSFGPAFLIQTRIGHFKLAE